MRPTLSRAALRSLRPGGVLGDTHSPEGAGGMGRGLAGNIGVFRGPPEPSYLTAGLRAAEAGLSTEFFCHLSLRP